MDEEVKFNEVGDLVPITPQEYIVDPRQQMCWDNYVKTVIAGQPDIKNSAIKAGYTENSAAVMGQAKWFMDKKKKLKRVGMLTKAEKNLNDILNMPFQIKRQVRGKEVMEVDTDVLRIVVDVSKTIVKSLGKDEGYSDRSEVTGKGGDPIVFMPAELLNKHNLTTNK